MKIKASSKTILVTGGAGFIGSHFVRHIYSKYPSYKIVNFDDLTYAGNLTNLMDIERAEKSSKKARYNFIKGNINNGKWLRVLFTNYKFDAVVNFAAESHVDNSISRAHEFIETNISGLFTLVTVAREFKTPRFVQISTDEVYGDVEKGKSTEDSPFRPSNPYSASKASADLIVQSYIRTHQFPAIIMRGSNNFGSHQYPEKLIPGAVTNILEGKPALLHGDGSQIRTWLHVEDFCRAIDLAMHQAPDGSIYNVSGIPLSVFEILKRITSTLGVSEMKFIHRVDDRPGQDRRYYPDDNKIRHELGWEPIYSIHNSLEDVVNWYVQSPNWWKEIKKTKRFKLYDGKWQGLYALKQQQWALEKLK